MRTRTLLSHTVVVLAALTGIAGCTERGPAATPSDTPTPARHTASAAPAARGNGVEQLKPLEILDRARQASTAATSLRVRGRLRDGEQVIGLDLRVQGDNATGWITMDGQRLDLIRTGSLVYLKGDKQFWTSAGGESAAELLDGKYLKFKADDKDFADLASLTYLSQIFSELPEPDDFTLATKGSPTKINGIPAIPVGDTTDAKLYVATEGKPYLLRLSPGKGSDHLDFLDYGVPANVRPPAADLVIDVDNLG